MKTVFDKLVTTYKKHGHQAEEHSMSSVEQAC
jgi:hypothetical protein